MSALRTEQRGPTAVVLALAAVVVSSGCTTATPVHSTRFHEAACRAGQQVYFQCATDSAMAVLCGTAGGGVLYRTTAGPGEERVIRSGTDAQLHYNRFTRPRATHEEVSFELGGRRHALFRYYDADFGATRMGLSATALGTGQEEVDYCAAGATANFAPLAEFLPCDPDSALGCP